MRYMTEIYEMIFYDNLFSGTYTLDKGRSVFMSMSGPSWSTTLCGMIPAFTGVTNNDWEAPWVSDKNMSVSIVCS